MISQKPCPKIRKSTEKDLPTIMALINAGKQWMKSKGPEQWPDFYPNQDIILEDIGRGQSYVLEDHGDILGTFSVVAGPQLYYETLVEGEWLYKGTNYAVCGRMSIQKSQKGRGLGQLIMTQFQKLSREGKYKSIRVSTYEHNTRMKQLMADNKYKLCGKFQVPGKVLVLAYELLLEDQL